jgi:hypothetical protein
VDVSPITFLMSEAYHAVSARGSRVRAETCARFLRGPFPCVALRTSLERSTLEPWPRRRFTSPSLRRRRRPTVASGLAARACRSVPPASRVTRGACSRFMDACECADIASIECLRCRRPGRRARDPAVAASISRWPAALLRRRPPLRRGDIGRRHRSALQRHRSERAARGPSLAVRVHGATRWRGRASADLGDRVRGAQRCGSTRPRRDLGRVEAASHDRGASSHTSKEHWGQTSCDSATPVTVTHMPSSRARAAAKRLRDRRHARLAKASARV